MSEGSEGAVWTLSVKTRAHCHVNLTRVLKKNIISSSVSKSIRGYLETIRWSLPSHRSTNAIGGYIVSIILSCEFDSRIWLGVLDTTLI